MASGSKNKISSKRGYRLIGSLVLALLLMESLFYTWCRVQCVGSGYAIAQENREQQELKSLQNSLKIELARLKAPENLSRIARGKMALAVPGPHQIIVVP